MRSRASDFDVRASARPSATRGTRARDRIHPQGEEQKEGPPIAPAVEIVKPKTNPSALADVPGTQLNALTKGSQSFLDKDDADENVRV